jgi:hypothetical protein
MFWSIWSTMITRPSTHIGQLDGARVAGASPVPVTSPLRSPVSATTVRRVLPLRFIPYADAATTPNVVVDGAAAAATRLTLSHWPGAPTPPELRADLSAEIVLRALDEPARFAGVDAVTNTHFDQDGLASVYALVAPEGARARHDRVIDVARAGDFGTFVDRDAARIAFAIASYDDPATSPLPAALFGGSYAELSDALYAEVLPRFEEMLDRPDRWRAQWEDEDAHLDDSIDAIARGVVRIEERPALDLAIVTVPESWEPHVTHRFTRVDADAVHPMAVANATERTRLVYVHGDRYRLQFRYETWVMFTSRPVAARRDLTALAQRLDALEPAGARWHADPVDAITPELRLPGDAVSGIPAETFVREVCAYLEVAPPAWDPYAPRG